MLLNFVTWCSQQSQFEFIHTGALYLKVPELKDSQVTGCQRADSSYFLHGSSVSSREDCSESAVAQSTSVNARELVVMAYVLHAITNAVTIKWFW